MKLASETGRSAVLAKRRHLWRTMCHGAPGRLPARASWFAFVSGARKPGQLLALTGFHAFVQRVEGTCAQFVSAVSPRRSARRMSARLRPCSPVARQRGSGLFRDRKPSSCEVGCCSLPVPCHVASLVLPGTFVARFRRRQRFVRIPEHRLPQPASSDTPFQIIAIDNRIRCGPLPRFQTSPGKARAAPTVSSPCTGNSRAPAPRRIRSPSACESNGSGMPCTSCTNAEFRSDRRIECWRNPDSGNRPARGSARWD